jgi:general secretion pathway protein J
MMRRTTRRGLRSRRAAVSGFTLIEALAATALMGVVLGALATIAGQWLPNWNRGIARVQRSELVSIAVNRLVADLGASEFVPPNRDTKVPLFEGTESAVTLVRSVIGPNLRPGLEIVRIAETSEGGGTVLVRSTTPFAPLAPNVTSVRQIAFGNPVALLRDPYRVAFAYAGRDGSWKTTWQNASELPAAIRMTILDAVSRRTLSISTTALVHVQIPAACASAKNKTNCVAQPADENEGQGNNPPQPAPPVQRSALPVAGRVS